MVVFHRYLSLPELMFLFFFLFPKSIYIVLCEEVGHQNIAKMAVRLEAFLTGTPDPAAAAAFKKQPLDGPIPAAPRLGHRQNAHPECKMHIIADSFKQYSHGKITKDHRNAEWGKIYLCKTHQDTAYIRLLSEHTLW